MMEASRLGSWASAKKLGTGGFGLVTLWVNESTGEHLAIKSLRERELQGVIQEKHKERWRKEVEIMKRLKHDNVVAALDIPKELDVLQETSPILAMEFCKLGDLRQILVKRENCCGLKESVVCDILRDVSNGLAYLHSCKIIHRDLKPDNIVLQDCDGKVVYKLTDLGFAKELDQSSFCESFVGTVQYLAPELFLSKPYTCSVDFWSFGLVTYEIITGHRPFLPGCPPVIWMKHIQDKKRNVISVHQSLSGEIVHSSSISKVNNFSSCLRSEMEKWLQVALDWDGKSRGRNAETQELVIFSMLQELMEKVVVRIFSLPTRETLSYFITKDTSVANLMNRISNDTGLEPDNQTLLLPGGESLNPKANLWTSLPEKRLPEEIALYLFSPGLIEIRSKTMVQPLSTCTLLKNPKVALEYPHLKKTTSDAVFFVQLETNFYKDLLSALKTKVENVNQRCAALDTLLEDVIDEWSQVEACSQFLVLSHKADLEHYIELRKAGRIAVSDLVQKWIKKTNDVESKLNELRSSSNKGQMKMDVDKVTREAAALVNHPFMKDARTALDDLLDESLNLYQRVQNIPKDVRGHPMCNTNIARVVLKTMETSAKLLKSSELNDFCLKIFESEDHLAKLISPLTILLKSTKVMRTLIENTQKERQRDVWSLLPQQPAVKPIETTKNSSTLNTEKTEQKTNKFSPFHIPKTVVYNDLVSPIDDHILRPEFRLSGPVSLGCLPTSPVPEVPSFANDIIKENYQLRHRTEDLANTCKILVQEVQSLNWDYLNET